MHGELFFLFGDYDFKSWLCFEERDAGCKAHDSGADDEDVAVDWLLVRGGGHGGSVLKGAGDLFAVWLGRGFLHNVTGQGAAIYLSKSSSVDHERVSIPGRKVRFP